MKLEHQIHLHQYFQWLAEDIRKTNEKWNTDLITGQPLQRNKLEMMMLIVGEIAEAQEGVRKDLMDKWLPHRKQEEVELADAVIRIIDYCNVHGFDLMGAMLEKNEFNKTRQDHTREARLAPGGKKL